MNTVTTIAIGWVLVAKNFLTIHNSAKGLHHVETDREMAIRAQYIHKKEDKRDHPNNNL
jgi:hypothetical protein